MNDKDGSVVIWTEDGCWLQQTVSGVRRSSYLGRIGTPEEVREWCSDQNVGFATKFHPFSGVGMAERWPRS